MGGRCLLRREDAKEALAACCATSRVERHFSVGEIELDERRAIIERAARNPFVARSQTEYRGR